MIADKALAAALHCEEGPERTLVGTVSARAAESVPIAWTDYYLPPGFRAVGRSFGKRVGPIRPLLERKYEIAIARIEQDIGA